MQVSIRSSRLHLAKGVFCSKFRVLNPAPIVVVGCHSSFNALRCDAGPLGSSLGCCEEDFCGSGYVLCIALVDFGMPDDSQDCVGVVGGFFLPLRLDRRDESRIVLPEVSEQVPL